MSNRTTVMTPEQIHLGLYRRGDTETRGEAQIAPRKLVIDETEVAKEVASHVSVIRHLLKQGDSEIQLQCTTPKVEREVKKRLGKDAKKVKFLPPKVESIRGQFDG